MIIKWAKFLFTVNFVIVLPNLAFAVENAGIDTGTTAWMLTATALVLLMVPGLAMFYGGLVRTKNVLGTMMHSFVAMAVIGVLWAICGYSHLTVAAYLSQACGFGVPMTAAFVSAAQGGGAFSGTGRSQSGGRPRRKPA